mmetsp:Transcript_79481/g.223307  ORF Transcript_79481/g.223307 Transcript_79481/m.223307 type:complete len:239 (+) Transcript_79481:336-1052(+)
MRPVFSCARCSATITREFGSTPMLLLMGRKYSFHSSRRIWMPCFGQSTRSLRPVSRSTRCNSDVSVVRVEGARSPLSSTSTSDAATCSSSAEALEAKPPSAAAAAATADDRRPTPNSLWRLVGIVSAAEARGGISSSPASPLCGARASSNARPERRGPVEGCVKARPASNTTPTASATSASASGRRRRNARRATGDGPCIPSSSGARVRRRKRHAERLRRRRRGRPAVAADLASGKES